MLDYERHVIGSEFAGRPERMSVPKIAKKYGVGVNTPKRVWDTVHARKSLDRKKGTGRKWRLNEYHLEILKNYLIEHDGDKTYEEIYQWAMEEKPFKDDNGNDIKVSVGCVHKTLNKRLGIRLVYKRTKPILTEQHREKRKAFACELMSDGTDFTDYVDIDEKWFYVWDNKRRLKILPGYEARRMPVHSKKHIQKVMFLSAIARPRPEHGFDGLVGIWRVCTSKTALRNSKYHKKGEVYDCDTNMDGDNFIQMVCEKVIPSIRQKMHWASKVRVQMDGASPHTRDGVDDALSTCGAAQPQPEPGSNTHIEVSFIVQPACSPDMNCNDLAFFNSIGSKVSKRVKSFSKDKLCEIVEEEFRNYDTAKLEDIWLLKRALLPIIAAADGGNWYTVPHGLVHDRQKRAFSTPRALHQGIQTLAATAADVAEDGADSGDADGGDDGDATDDDDDEMEWDDEIE